MYFRAPARSSRCTGRLPHLRSKVWQYQLVLVDDGSTKGTWPAIGRIAQHDPRARGVRLARTFGQHAAILAGLKHVTMDPDLQWTLIPAHQTGTGAGAGVEDRSDRLERWSRRRAFPEKNWDSTGAGNRSVRLV